MTEEARLANRLAWITGLRLGFLSLLLGAVAFFYLRGALGSYRESQHIVFASIASAYTLAAVYAALLRRRKQLQRVAEAQIVLDQITWTAIVYVSGGATSGATSLYGLTCLVGAVLVGLRGAAIAAFAGVGAFGALCAGFAFRVISAPADQPLAGYASSWDDVFYPLLVNCLGIVVVALLAGYLAERLRRTGGALEEANERAMAAERLAVLGRIATGLAHEIRNPLGSISGSIELLREAPGLGEEDRKLCEIIQREAARLNHLVTDMMDLARPRKPEPEIVDVVGLARDVVELASRSERGSDVIVRYRGPTEPVWVRCDAAQMRQVLWNLVRNGVQASAAGETVEVAIEEDEKRVRMSVVDDGPGLSAETSSKIFDAFFTTRSHGAGIGLAVVRRIIDDHAPFGVTIDVKSSEGRGATFEVGLARAEPRTKSTSGTEDASEPGRDRDLAVAGDASSRSRALSSPKISEER